MPRTICWSLACLVATLTDGQTGRGADITAANGLTPLAGERAAGISLVAGSTRRTWPVLLAAGLAGFFVYDLQGGGPIRSIVWLILSNAVEVLTAALCLNSSFEGVPRL